jgi:uncharacterized membrane protein
VSLLLPALAALAFFVWLGRRQGRGGEWRPAAAVVALAAYVGAAVAGLRSEWLLCLALLAAGGALSVSARKRPSRPTVDAARAVLGVGAQASADEIRAAHRRLMQEAHPDRGGDAGRAAALNAARDRLLRKR